MNQKDINSKNSRNQRDRIILKLMYEFNLSFDEANEAWIQIEKKYNFNKVPKKQVQNYNDSIESKKISNQKNEFIPASNINSINRNERNIPKNKVSNTNQVSNQNELFSKSNKYSTNQNKTDNPKQNSVPETTELDSILEELIPNYGQQISIIADHIDLTFEVQDEKVDTLKENFIRTLKRNKSKKTKIHALKDISFKIYKGDKVGIIGYNGAGKSTLLNVIAGIYPPDNGRVTTYGKISPLLSLGAGFDHNFSGRRNIMINGAVLGYDKKYLESKTDEIIEFSELGDFIDIPIKNYSSGMLAKLGFSIATAVNPDILIIDEVLGVGDVNFQKKSRDKMKSLMDGQTTVLLVSHSIPQIRELCDKAIWIDNGYLREIGEVNKVCDHYLKDAEKASKEQLAYIQFR